MITNGFYIGKMFWHFMAGSLCKADATNLLYLDCLLWPCANALTKPLHTPFSAAAHKELTSSALSIVQHADGVKQLLDSIHMGLDLGFWAQDMEFWAQDCDFWAQGSGP